MQLTTPSNRDQAVDPDGLMRLDSSTVPCDYDNCHTSIGQQWRCALLLEIDAKDDRPAYLQIIDQVKYAAASGRLRAGEALPSIRQLAERLRVNRNTVDKAYRELDRQGLITTAQGRGAFLSDSVAAAGTEWRQELLSEALDHLIGKAHQLNVAKAELIELLDERYDAAAAAKNTARRTEADGS